LLVRLSRTLAAHPGSHGGHLCCHCS